ncbi:hypothetical protein PN499_16440 [Kamptonema animale CS-326]|uniref:hypothetical protein n=1 Tax=Kamptonema animale TaxID=92934 RepID=UPI00232CF34F|nr:hypothetical protein [Kamptonema animale]MDB9512778.1 hypothetical protein [Kamptonema animale CS-326]
MRSCSRLPAIACTSLYKLNQGVLAIGSKIAIATKSESGTKLAGALCQSDNCYNIWIDSWENARVALA